MSFTVTAVDCDGNKLSPTAEEPGWQVPLATRAEVDAYLTTTRTGFAPAPEGGGPRPRNRVTRFTVTGPQGTEEVERGGDAHAAAVDRAAKAAEATKLAAKAAKAGPKVELDAQTTELQAKIRKLDARLARAKKPDTVAALTAERDQLVAQLR